MRVLVTGATGFVGQWLVRELEGSGHTVVATPPRTALDITNDPAVRRFVAAASPDAVAHLAAVSFAGEAARDPQRALAINEGGTRALLQAVALMAPGARVLVTSSSEVYGRPADDELPIAEGNPLRADRPYGRSKLAQEEAAQEIAASHDVPLILVRPFNHTGPGQRTDFVVPALASRILEAARDGSATIRAGNVDVRRDIGDVRDVVRAYRLLLEAAVSGERPERLAIYNVATGRSVAIREIIERLAGLAGVTIAVETDAGLVRADDPPDIRGDATRLREAVDWEPAVPLSTTLADVLASVAMS